MKNTIRALACLVSFTAMTTVSAAECDPGEIVIKFSHVTNANKHPKGIAASLLSDRVNEEMNGTACMEVFPNSTLLTDEKALEA
ncbi:MAG: C4-dicarboxylate ABC transporter, partial [Roseibium sp.]|nr:C4-dicarboxylate ABC transporter [Roseibium sp.]